jgi:multidrug resistance efflux pump
VNAKRMIVLQTCFIFIVIIAGFVGYYFYNQSTNYIKTDNAQVSGQQIVIAAPATGKLTNWNGQVGQHFHSGDTVGTIQVSTGNGTANVNVTDPSDSTIVQNLAVDNQFVAAGTPLAYAYDMNNLWVTANIKETEINHVKVGQTVDVYIDAYPGTTYSGVVKQIGYATASTFSPLPTGNTDANHTKVTQVIPVKIQLTSGVSGLVPGMNATVRIHR